MESPQQAVPVRTPEASAPGMLSVIGPDGRTDPDTDPRLPVETVVSFYKAMVRTRVIDQQLERLQRQGRIGFHIGSLGEEGCVIGSVSALRESDWMFPCYREFGALLWRGMPLQGYVDNMYGNGDDPVKGRQMPDHYTGRPYHYGSVSSPIGTQMPQAVGFSWAAKIKGDDVVAGVYLGDGSTSSNDFHVALNFAGVFKTPTVFFLRNNRWAISVPSERQTASKDFATKAVAYGIRGIRCDGNDVLATYRAARESIERAARGEGPTLLEMCTYRLGGHSTSDDPRVYRQQDEVEQWRKTDPIVRLRKHLGVLGAWDDAQDEAFRAETEAELRACVEAAEKKDGPSLESMFEDVFEEVPWHLREQQRELVDGPRAPRLHG